MKRKGFTIIELLAVIVLLAVLAIIIVPIINDIIEKARMEAFRDTGYGLVESAHVYDIKNLDGSTNKTFSFPNDYDGLLFKGEVPKGGTLKINGKKTELYVYNDKYCASKSFDTDIVSVGKVEKDENGKVTNCNVKLTDEDGCIQPIISENPSNDIWYKNKTVTINYSLKENCDVKEYRINGGGWREYKEPFILYDDAKVEARMVSATGKLNPSSIALKNIIKIDTVAPYAKVSFNNGNVKLDATDYIQNNGTPSGINNNSYKIKLGENVVAEKTNEANITIDTTKSNVISYEVSDNATNKYEGNITIEGGENKTSYCSLPIVTIDKMGWSYDKTATIEFIDCDKHEYSIDGGRWSKYIEPLKFEKNSVLRVRNRSLDPSVAPAILTVNINQIDRVAPYTPIVLNYATTSTKNGSIQDFGYECTTDSIKTTEPQRCAIWVNCSANEGKTNICHIPFNYSQEDNEGGSGVVQSKYIYKFMKDGNVLDSTSTYATSFNDGGEIIEKDKSIYNVKVYDLVGNESNDLELTIYWKANKKGTLDDGRLKLKVGDYVKMTPTVESFTTDPNMTGYSAPQTIYPKNLNLWRVIRVNDDGTYDVVSDSISSEKIIFRGITGYKNYVGYLNILSSKYENPNFTVKTENGKRGSRHMGFNGQTEYLNTTYLEESSVCSWDTRVNNPDNTGGEMDYFLKDTPIGEPYGQGDALYLTDFNLIKNVYGKADYVSIGNGYQDGYHMASRAYIKPMYSTPTSRYCDFYIRFSDVSTLNGFNTINGNIFSFNEKDDPKFTNWEVIGKSIRPILTLKRELYGTGDGTLNKPYVLAKRDGMFYISDDNGILGFSSEYVDEKSIVIPDVDSNGNPITSIKSGAFSNIRSLESVVIGNNIETIGDGAFASTALSNLTIGNKVKTIGSSSFAGTSITSLTIPNSVTTIGPNSFAGNVNLTTVTLGSSLINIGTQAFAGDVNLETINNNSSLNLNDYKNTAFMGCPKLSW